MHLHQDAKCNLLFVFCLLLDQLFCIITFLFCLQLQFLLSVIGSTTSKFIFAPYCILVRYATICIENETQYGLLVRKSTRQRQNLFVLSYLRRMLECRISSSFPREGLREAGEVLIQSRLIFESRSWLQLILSFTGNCQLCFG